jgi:hypothetical protein
LIFEHLNCDLSAVVGKVCISSRFARQLRKRNRILLCLVKTKAENTREVLEMVKGAMDAGARGTTVGRKIWQSPNPGAMVRAVSMIVHEGADVDRALRILN